ncbi:MAG TPA: protein-tyrosine phosphatase family protein [Tepidisphaeraceae bacterium]|jgi:protein tyrosine/serine phosphatase
MPSKNRNKFARGIFGWILFLAVSGALIYLFNFDTYHFAVVQDGVLYRMGMRNTRELQNVIHKVHPKTVVCLVTDQEVSQGTHGDFQGEFKLLKDNGITLVRIPMTEDHPPTQTQIDQFLHIATDKNNQPVIVHCAQGVIRTGMMVAAYQKDVLGYSKQQALDSINIFGKGHQRADEVKAFINDYYAHPERQVATTQ